MYLEKHFKSRYKKNILFFKKKHWCFHKPLVRNMKRNVFKNIIKP